MPEEKTWAHTLHPAFQRPPGFLERRARRAVYRFFLGVEWVEEVVYRLRHRRHCRSRAWRRLQAWFWDYVLRHGGPFR